MTSLIKKFFGLESLTAHRIILDKYLEESEVYMIGKVLDIGGKKVLKRGYFKPPLDKVEKWEYLNIDKRTKPDYCCSAEDIPLTANSFDTVLLCEILEHLENPEKAIKEAERILKPGGNILISMPFLFPIHGDPDDFQRYTDLKLIKLLEGNNIKIIKIKTMGYYYTVLSDFLMLGILNKKNNKYKRCILWILFKPLFNILLKLDKKSEKNQLTSFAGGFFIIGEKPEG